MFTKKEVFEFKEFLLIDSIGNTYKYKIEGNITPLNNKEVTIELDRESEIIFDIIKELMDFKKKEWRFVESTFHLKDKHEMKIPFKYVSGGLNNEYDFLIDRHDILAEKLGIVLLTE